LDSFEAARVVESMKKLASSGKTVIFTIHQPSSELFELFDKICLIAEGRCAFIGDKQDAVSFFESQSLICPLNYNPADFYIKTFAISPIEREACLTKVKVIIMILKSFSFFILLYSNFIFN
jgi:ABC-type multidrug transport system ATPase subunit